MQLNICWLENQKFFRHHRTTCDDGGMVVKAATPNRTYLGHTQCTQKLYSILEGRFSGDSLGG